EQSAVVEPYQDTLRLLSVRERGHSAAVDHRLVVLRYQRYRVPVGGQRLPVGTSGQQQAGRDGDCDGSHVTDSCSSGRLTVFGGRLGRGRLFEVLVVGRETGRVGEPGQ